MGIQPPDSSEADPLRIYKPEIRNKLRKKRRQLEKESIQKAAEQVAAKMIHFPEFIESKKIAFYIPQENELDPMPIINCTLTSEKSLYLPTIPPNGSKMLSFYPYAPGDPLVKNRYRILEPDINLKTPIDRWELDLILVPLVGFDKSCNRLGRGAGHYDHTLDFSNTRSQKRPWLIGLGYEFQKIPIMIPSKWDIPLDQVVTEESLYIRTEHVTT